MSENILNSERIAIDGTLVRDNFSNWFRKSQIVSEEGSPQVVYHGSTRGGISTASRSTGFFSSCPKVASTYALDDYESSKGEDKVVQAFYLRIENPLIVDAQGESWCRIEFGGRRYTTDDLARLAERNGHDGLVIRNVEDNVNDEELPPADIFVTFGKAAQLKSAIGNNGLFDPECNDVTDRLSKKADPAYINAQKAIRSVSEFSNKSVRISRAVL